MHLSYAEILVYPTRKITSSASDNRVTGNSTLASLRVSFQVSNAFGTVWPGVFELKRALLENPSGCQRNSLFPHQQATQRRLGCDREAGAGSSVVVGLLRMRSGRKGQQRRASLLSDRVTNKHFPAAGNSALKLCKMRKTWCGQKGSVV